MQKQTTFTLAGALAGASQTLPLIISTLAIGTIFGVLSRQKALGIGEALLMSGLVFGGSAQFLVLSLWGASLPVLTIVIATLVINIRYILMGSTLSLWFARLSWLAGTTIGQVLGSVVSNPAQWGLDFAFPAIFAALLVARRTKQVLVAMLAGVFAAWLLRHVL